MPELNALQLAGRDRLGAVALAHATRHGLHRDAIERVEQYDGWWLTVNDPRHTVREVFSLDEIEDFAAAGDGAKGSKRKIRDAFASLAM